MPHYCRTASTIFGISSSSGALTIYGNPYPLNLNLEDVLALSVGPRDKFDGIKSCLTYTPPGDTEPGYQSDRGVVFFDIRGVN